MHLQFPNLDIFFLISCFFVSTQFEEIAEEFSTVYPEAKLTGAFRVIASLAHPAEASPVAVPINRPALSVH